MRIGEIKKIETVEPGPLPLPMPLPAPSPNPTPSPSPAPAPVKEPAKEEPLVPASP